MAIRKISSRSLGDSQVDTADIADGSVDLVKLSATGTKDATTYLRGDNTFSALSTTLAGLDDATVSASAPTATENPTSGVGHLWLVSSSGKAYVLTDATTNANVWVNVADVGDRYNISDALIVAGGGGGGARGGGGAGGYIQSSDLSVVVGDVITATVGLGGSQGGDGAGGDGGNSVLSSGAARFSTLTAIGGGGGGDGVGRDGGSGGGGDYPSQAGGSGTVGQGNDGGIGKGSATVTGGGGGGATSQGGNGGSTGGAGGAGIADSITGSSVTYAGGGGGGSETVPGGSGGSGGGGRGAYNANYNGDSGTDGLGGGGGGSYNTTWTGGDGGDGVVIIRVPTANYSGTTTGSPTITTDGFDTIIKFTQSGTYTA